MYRSAHQLIEHMMKILSQAEKRRLDKFIATMIDQNQEAHARPLDGFHYQGVHYRREGLRGTLTRTVLHLSLHPEMDRHLKDREIVRDDEQKIRQMLFKLTDNAFCEQDIRDAIPDCIADTLPDSCKALERRRDPTFFLNHPRDFRQYEKVLPKIEFYSAARLLY